MGAAPSRETHRRMMGVGETPAPSTSPPFSSPPLTSSISSPPPFPPGGGGPFPLSSATTTTTGTTAALPPMEITGGGKKYEIVLLPLTKQFFPSADCPLFVQFHKARCDVAVNYYLRQPGNPGPLDVIPQSPLGERYLQHRLEDGGLETLYRDGERGGMEGLGNEVDVGCTFHGTTTPTTPTTTSSPNGAAECGSFGCYPSREALYRGVVERIEENLFETDAEMREAYFLQEREKREGNAPETWKTAAGEEKSDKAHREEDETRGGRGGPNDPNATCSSSSSCSPLRRSPPVLPVLCAVAFRADPKQILGGGKGGNTNTATTSGGVGGGKGGGSEEGEKGTVPVPERSGKKETEGVSASGVPSSSSSGSSFPPPPPPPEGEGVGGGGTTTAPPTSSSLVSTFCATLPSTPFAQVATKYGVWMNGSFIHVVGCFGFVSISEEVAAAATEKHGKRSTHQKSDTKEEEAATTTTRRNTEDGSPEKGPRRSGMGGRASTDGSTLGGASCASCTPEKEERPVETTPPPPAAAAPLVAMVYLTKSAGEQKLGMVTLRAAKLYYSQMIEAGVIQRCPPPCLPPPKRTIPSSGSSSNGRSDSLPNRPCPSAVGAGYLPPPPPPPLPHHQHYHLSSPPPSGWRGGGGGGMGRSESGVGGVESPFWVTARSEGMGGLGGGMSGGDGGEYWQGQNGLVPSLHPPPPPPPISSGTRPGPFLYSSSPPPPPMMPSSPSAGAPPLLSSSSSYGSTGSIGMRDPVRGWREGSMPAMCNSVPRTALPPMDTFSFSTLLTNIPILSFLYEMKWRWGYLGVIRAQEGGGGGGGGEGGAPGTERLRGGGRRKGNGKDGTTVKEDPPRPPPLLCPPFTEFPSHGRRHSLSSSGVGGGSPLPSSPTHGEEEGNLGMYHPFPGAASPSFSSSSLPHGRPLPQHSTGGLPGVCRGCGEEVTGEMEMWITDDQMLHGRLSKNLAERLCWSLAECGHLLQDCVVPMPNDTESYWRYRGLVDRDHPPPLPYAWSMDAREGKTRKTRSSETKTKRKKKKKRAEEEETEGEGTSRKGETLKNSAPPPCHGAMENEGDVDAVVGVRGGGEGATEAAEAPLSKASSHIDPHSLSPFPTNAKEQEQEEQDEETSLWCTDDDDVDLEEEEERSGEVSVIDPCDVYVVGRNVLPGFDEGDILRFSPQHGVWFADPSISLEGVVLAAMRPFSKQAREAPPDDPHWVTKLIRVSPSEEGVGQEAEEEMTAETEGKREEKEGKEEEEKGGGGGGGWTTHSFPLPPPTPEQAAALKADSTLRHVAERVGNFFLYRFERDGATYYLGTLPNFANPRKRRGAGRAAAAQAAFAVENAEMSVHFIRPSFKEATPSRKMDTCTAGPRLPPPSLPLLPPRCVGASSDEEEGGGSSPPLPPAGEAAVRAEGPCSRRKEKEGEKRSLPPLLLPLPTTTEEPTGSPTSPPPPPQEEGKKETKKGKAKEKSSKKESAGEEEERKKKGPPTTFFPASIASALFSLFTFSAEQRGVPPRPLPPFPTTTGETAPLSSLSTAGGEEVPQTEKKGAAVPPPTSTGAGAPPSSFYAEGSLEGNESQHGGKGKSGWGGWGWGGASPPRGGGYLLDRVKSSQSSPSCYPSVPPAVAAPVVVAETPGEEETVEEAVGSRGNRPPLATTTTAASRGKAKGKNGGGKGMPTLTPPAMAPAGGGGGLVPPLPSTTPTPALGTGGTGGGNTGSSPARPTSVFFNSATKWLFDRLQLHPPPSVRPAISNPSRGGGPVSTGAGTPSAAVTPVLSMARGGGGGGGEGLSHTLQSPLPLPPSALSSPTRSVPASSSNSGSTTPLPMHFSHFRRSPHRAGMGGSERERMGGGGVSKLPFGALSVPLSPPPQPHSPPGSPTGRMGGGGAAGGGLSSQGIPASEVQDWNSFCFSRCASRSSLGKTGRQLSDSFLHSSSLSDCYAGLGSSRGPSFPPSLRVDFHEFFNPHAGTALGVGATYPATTSSGSKSRTTIAPSSLTISSSSLMDDERVEGQGWRHNPYSTGSISRQHSHTGMDGESSSSSSSSNFERGRDGEVKGDGSGAQPYTVGSVEKRGIAKGMEIYGPPFPMMVRADSRVMVEEGGGGCHGSEITESDVREEGKESWGGHTGGGGTRKRSSMHSTMGSFIRDGVGGGGSSSFRSARSNDSVSLKRIHSNGGFSWDWRMSPDVGGGPAE